MLDSGIRATELCGLTMDDISAVSLKVHGKGDKERSVPLSDRSWKAIMNYLQSRDHAEDKALFVSERGRALTRSGLYQLLKRLGESVGVERAHPHRLRHTFAINYLRNGGDVYTLMKILGHSSMEMTKKYLAIAQADVEIVHRRASPVKGWDL
jgi:site-specific recombinase XerD